MTFRIGGAGKRRDVVEPEIIDALRCVGCEVWQVSGRGLFDIIARREDRYFPMEIKSSTGKRTKPQRDVPWPIVRSVDEALNVVNQIRETR